MTIALNSVSGGLPASFFCRFLLSFSLGGVLFSPSCLLLRVSFCVWCRSAMSPSVCKVALCSRNPWGLVVRFTWPLEPVLWQCPLLVLCVTFCCFESWLLLACPWVELTLKLAGCENWPQPQCMSCCLEADPTSGIYPSSLLPAETSLWVCHFWSWVMLCCGLKLTSQLCLFCGLLREPSMQVNIRRCLLLVLGSLLGDTTWSTFGWTVCYIWVNVRGTKLDSKA